MTVLGAARSDSRPVNAGQGTEAQSGQHRLPPSRLLALQGDDFMAELRRPVLKPRSTARR
jgi:hypothetical protein